MYRIRDTEVTVILMEYDMGLVMRISDEVLVLDYGEVIAEGSLAKVHRRPQGHRGLSGIGAGMKRYGRRGEKTVCWQ